MSTGYMYGKSLEQSIPIGETENEKSFKLTDRFGGELKYVSVCFQNDETPAPASEAVRDRLLAVLDDADRRRIVGLFGSMTDPLPEPSPEVWALLVAIAALNREDRRRFTRWVGKYVTRWGQVPSAAGHRIAHPERH